ncbi:hypothetical protein [Pseudofulvibacter geojedonensis]|uniref:Uncharacterized protein n=1 Tax=Pseudofulvibacter geojedonensis TaxID=1123758 RepID=A0ABW3I1W7_9FLAO
MNKEEKQYKKPTYKIKAPLKEHLKTYSRYADLPLTYDDLTVYQDLIPVTNDAGESNLWLLVIYNSYDIDRIYEQLIQIYELLVADGDKVPFLKIERIEFCSFGNSQPFRIKVKNEINDNHDYFYIKRADSSRVYGLELEEIFSPDKVSFLVNNSTIVIEHIVGIPCDEFIKTYSNIEIENRLGFAKEFVKFNERCFVRLLGDIRAYNFIIEIIQDFDNVQYRMRSIDFDQQSYEGRKSLYLPQYFRDNIKLVNHAQEMLLPEISNQYAREERVAMRKRFLASRQRTKSLLRKMRRDNISTIEHINRLKKELGAYHKNEEFKNCKNMGEILTLHLEQKLGIKIF